MVVGEGLFVTSFLTLRAAAARRCLAMLGANLGRRFLPSLKTRSILLERLIGDWEVYRDGGGGRIRTFEVDDGRFTVCSLWPLGNPTTEFVV